MNEILSGVCIGMVLCNLLLTRKLMRNDLSHLSEELKEFKNEFNLFKKQVLDYIFEMKEK